MLVEQIENAFFVLGILLFSLKVQINAIVHPAAA